MSKHKSTTIVLRKGDYLIFMRQRDLEMNNYFRKKFYLRLVCCR